MARNDVVHGGAKSLVGNVDHLHAGKRLQVRRRKMRRAARSRQGGGDLAFLGLRDQVREVALERASHGQDIGHRRQPRDRHPPGRVVVHFLEQEAVGRDRSRRCEHHGVTVGRGPPDVERADIAGRTGYVFRDDGAAPFAREGVRQKPRQNVGPRAGREWDHEPDRSCGVGILRMARRGAEEGAQGREQRKPNGPGRHPVSRMSWPLRPKIAEC